MAIGREVRDNQEPSGAGQDLGMSTRETRRDRGLRRGREIETRLVEELRSTRTTSDVSQRAISNALGWSQADFWRLETHRIHPSIVDISEVASLLGLELSAGLHPVGEPLRDKGHQALIRRFRAELASAFKVLAEVPLPTPGDRRSWDLLLRLPAQLIGVEAETRIRDMQRLVRHVHQREGDGGVDAIVLLLAATRTNRQLIEETRLALGPSYATSPRAILKSLRLGQPVPGSGVVML